MLLRTKFKDASKDASKDAVDGVLMMLLRVKTVSIEKLLIHLSTGSNGRPTTRTTDEAFQIDTKAAL